MLIRASILATCLFIVSAQKELRKEVDLITEPRPGQEFVHVHVSSGPSKPNKHYSKGVSGDAELGDVSYVAPVSKTKLKSPSIVSPKKAVPVELSPIGPAKDSRLLRLTSYSELASASASDVTALDEAHDFAAHNITRGQLLHKPDDVSIEDEGITGVIDESANAAPEERAILEQKHKGTNSYAVEEFEVELPANHKLSPSPVQIDADRQPLPQTSDHAETEQKNSNFERERHLEKKVLNLEKTKYDVIKLNEEEGVSKDGILGKPSKKDEDEGQIDFVDSPLADKVLTPSGSSKASRINVKKGPNGQDYEYEYVYYYYDDEDDEKSGSSTTTTSTTSAAPAARRPLHQSSAAPAPATEYHETPQRTRGKTTTESGIVYENNFRFINTDSNVERGTLPVAEPASNEILPPATGPRYQGRGRQLTATQAPATNIPVQEENLETNTRFPSRGRTQAAVTDNTYVPVATTIQQPVAPVKESKSRNSGTVKRPSVELVDSSSFQTHSNGVSAPEQEYFSPQHSQSTDYSQPQPTAGGDDSATTHAVSHQRGSRIRPTQNIEEEPSIGVQSVSNERIPLAGSTHKQDLEEYVSTPVSIGLESTKTRGFSQFRPAANPEGIVEIGTESVSPSSIATTAAQNNNGWRSLISPSPNSGAGNMPDKAAFDLYAYLQKTQNEESNYIIDDDRARSEDSGEEVVPIVQVSPSFQAVTTYLTTPSTTTTTTTEPPTTPTSTLAVAPTGRGKYRGSLTASRNRFKVSSTEQPLPTEENTTARRKFTPSHQRPAGHVSLYGRRGSKKSTTSSEDSSASSTEASQSTDEAESPKPFGSSTRNRYRGGSGARNSGSSTTTLAPTTAHSRPTFNADRYSRRRGGTNVKVTSTTVPNETDSEGKEDSSKKDENEQESNVSSTTAKPARARINIGSPSVRPLRPGPRINLGGRNRLPTATKAQPQTEEVESSPSPSSTASTSTDEAQQSNVEVHDIVSEAPVSSTTQDALTRLRNRPRLHVQSNKQTKLASPASASNRRQLVSGLLPKRRPSQAAQEAEQSEVPSSHPQENSQQDVESNDGNVAEAESAKPVSEAAEPQSSISSSEQPSTAPPNETKISSLIGRRRNLALGRRPGTVKSSKQNNAEQNN